MIHIYIIITLCVYVNVNFLYRHIACRNSNIRMCLMFLAHGASLDLQNDLGETAFDGIGDEDGACAKALLFNMKLRALARFGEQTIVSQ